MKKKTAIFGVDAKYHSNGWEPWRLVKDLPEEMNQLTFPLKIHAEYRELPRASTPFNAIRIGQPILNKIDRLYPLSEGSSATMDFLDLFLADLRDAFWFQYDDVEAINKYEELVNTMDANRKKILPVPVDELFFCSGLIIWEQLFRKQLLRKLEEIKSSNPTRIEDYFSNILKEIPFGSIRYALSWEFKKLNKSINDELEKRIRPYAAIEREAESPVFHLITHDLVENMKKVYAKNVESFEIIGKFYECFGIPVKGIYKYASFVESSYYRYKGKRKEILTKINSLYCKDLL